jgi:hypothetical protein
MEDIARTINVAKVLDTPSITTTDTFIPAATLRKNISKVAKMTKPINLLKSHNSKIMKANKLSVCDNADDKSDSQEDKELAQQREV